MTRRLSERYIFVLTWFIAVHLFANLPAVAQTPSDDVQDNAVAIQLIIADGLVAFYPFNGDARDASGQGNDGQVNGASLIPDRFGTSESAYLFDGEDDNIVVDNSASLNMAVNNQMSVTAWVNPQDLETDRFAHIIRKASGRFGSGYLFAFQNRGRELSLGINNSAGEESNTPIEPSYFAGDTWHFVAGTYDGRAFRIYVDGRLIGTQPLMQTINPNQDDPLFIGSYWRGQYFQGGIDDLRLYNRALTTSEIERLYQEEHAAVQPVDTMPTPAPVAAPSTPSPAITETPSPDPLATTPPTTGPPGSELPSPPPPNQAPPSQAPVPPADPLPAPPAIVAPTSGGATDDLPAPAPEVMPSEMPAPAAPPPDAPATPSVAPESPSSAPSPLPRDTAPSGTPAPPSTETPVIETPITETPIAEPPVAAPATPDPDVPPAGRIILPPALTPDVCQVQVANYFADSRRLVIPALQIELLDALTREPTGELATFSVTLTHEPEGTVFTIATSSVSLLEESEVEPACRATYDGQRIRIPLLEADAYIESLPGVRLPAPRQRLELVLEQNGTDDRTFKVESFELR
ncbi:MAG: LamG-like jellyroll fold domain-containing protein [Deinococcota bacterium]